MIPLRMHTLKHIFFPFSFLWYEITTFEDYEFSLDGREIMGNMNFYLQ